MLRITRAQQCCLQKEHLRGFERRMICHANEILVDLGVALGPGERVDSLVRDALNEALLRGIEKAKDVCIFVDAVLIIKALRGNDKSIQRRLDEIVCNTQYHPTTKAQMALSLALELVD